MAVTLVTVNQGGVAKLSNDTFYRIAPDHLRERVSAWRTGDEIVVSEAPSGAFQRYRLLNVRVGQDVGANESQARF